MNVNELILALIEFACENGDTAHVTIYDAELEMPAIVQRLEGNSHSVQLLTSMKEEGLTNEN